MTSETERTLAECKRRGWTVEKTEYWLPSFRVHDVAKFAKSYVDNPTTPNREELSLAVSYHKAAPGIRKDLFGFVDVLALTPDGFLAIQSTSRPNIGTRHLKIRTQCMDAARAWLRAGGHIEVWGWRKEKVAVDRKFWQVKVRPVIWEDVTT